MTFLSKPPETIRISVTGDNATALAGDWWAPVNSTTNELFPLLETVFQAATVPLLKAAAIREFLTELIFKSRSPWNVNSAGENKQLDKKYEWYLSVQLNFLLSTAPLPVLF